MPYGYVAGRARSSLRKIKLRHGTVIYMASWAWMSDERADLTYGCRTSVEGVGSWINDGVGGSAEERSRRTMEAYKHLVEHSFGESSSQVFIT